MQNGLKWYQVLDTGNPCSPSMILRFLKTLPFKDPKDILDSNLVSNLLGLTVAVWNVAG